jgi:hypothetical protein
MNYVLETFLEKHEDCENSNSWKFVGFGVRIAEQFKVLRWLY